MLPTIPSHGILPFRLFFLAGTLISIGSVYVALFDPELPVRFLARFGIKTQNVGATNWFAFAVIVLLPPVLWLLFELFLFRK